MPIGGPELELGIALGMEANPQPFIIIPHVQLGDHLCVAAVEALGQPHDGPEDPHDLTRRSRQIAEPFM